MDYKTPDQPFFSADEAAAISGRSIETVRAAIADRSLMAVTRPSSGELRIPRLALEIWLDPEGWRRRRIAEADAEAAATIAAEPPAATAAARAEVRSLLPAGWALEEQPHTRNENSYLDQARWVVRAVSPANEAHGSYGITAGHALRSLADQLRRLRLEQHLVARGWSLSDYHCSSDARWATDPDGREWLIDVERLHSDWHTADHWRMSMRGEAVGKGAQRVGILPAKLVTSPAAIDAWLAGVPPFDGATVTQG